MDLRSPSTLLAAWVLAPLLTAVAAGGLGLGVAAVTRHRLGPMTLPLGYAAGIVVMVVLLEVVLGGEAAVALTAAAALGGYAAQWAHVRALPSSRPALALRQSAPAAAA